MPEEKIGSMLCPNCGLLISLNAEVCIHCGTKNPGMWGLAPRMRGMLARFGVMEIITTLCVALYVVSILLDPSALFKPRGMLSFLAPSMQSLDTLGMTGSYAMAHGRWWTLVTAIYLHGGLLHILFNVMWIRQLAPQVEELFGTSRLILIFTFSGVLGFLISNFIGIPFTIGASGSIFGLLGAIVYYGRSRGGAFGMELYRQTMYWAVIMFVFGFMMSGVNNWAHGGGFAGGYLTAMFVGYSERKTEDFRLQALSLAVAGLTVVCFVMAIWQAWF